MLVSWVHLRHVKPRNSLKTRTDKVLVSTNTTGSAELREQISQLCFDVIRLGPILQSPRHRGQGAPSPVDILPVLLLAFSEHYTMLDIKSTQMHQATRTMTITKSTRIQGTTIIIAMILRLVMVKFQAAGMTYIFSTKFGNTVQLAG